MNVITKTVQLPDGRTITIETGKVAKQADGVLRWYIGLGIALGAIWMALLSAVFVRAYKKISTRICEKRVKRVDKSG